MEISITLSSVAGLNWDLWAKLALTIEHLGFSGLFRGDHFSMSEPPVLDSLEAFVSLTYLASHTQRVHFGTLVSPLSFRDPVMLTRQAMQIDDLSDGRMILGVGSGSLALEHSTFGYQMGDVKMRMDRLEEGLQVISGLLSNEEPVTFNGRYYQLRNARLLPHPKQPTRLLVGGNGPKRTLPLVARYADIWNCQVASIEVFKQRNALLDDLLYQEGRQLTEVKRTVMLPILTWQDQAGLTRLMDYARSIIGDLPDETILGWFRENMAAITGEPEQVIESMCRYQEAGVEEFIIQWFTLSDFTSLDFMANAILPHFLS